MALFNYLVVSFIQCVVNNSLSILKIFRPVQVFTNVNLVKIYEFSLHFLLVAGVVGLECYDCGKR